MHRHNSHPINALKLKRLIFVILSNPSYLATNYDGHEAMES